MPCAAEWSRPSTLHREGNEHETHPDSFSNPVSGLPGPPCIRGSGKREELPHSRQDLLDAGRRPDLRRPQRRPDGVAGGLQVTILFDASGVTALKKAGLLGGDKSPPDKAPLPERERRSLSTQLGVSLESVPHDYGEYTRFLKSKGVALYANRTMMLLYKIGENEIEKASTPVGLKQMVDILKSADVYVAY